VTCASHSSAVATHRSRAAISLADKGAAADAALSDAPREVQWRHGAEMAEWTVMKCETSDGDTCPRTCRPFGFAPGQVRADSTRQPSKVMLISLSRSSSTS